MMTKQHTIGMSIATRCHHHSLLHALLVGVCCLALVACSGGNGNGDDSDNDAPNGDAAATTSGNGNGNGNDGGPSTSAADLSPEQLVGTFVLDPEATRAATQQRADAANNDLATTGAQIANSLLDRGFIGSITLSADGTLTGELGEPEDPDAMSGTWTLTGTRISTMLVVGHRNEQAFVGPVEEGGAVIKLATPDNNRGAMVMVFRRSE